MSNAYPQAPGYKSGDTSREAAIKTAPRAGYLRDKVFALLTSKDLTSDECAALMGESVLSIRPRVTELFKQGLIRDTGARRTNSSGHRAKVWGLAKEQGTLFSL